MKLSEAQTIAAGLVEQMRPFCSRIEVAGSIRREKAECTDIEIVAVPRWETRVRETGGLFGESEEYSVNLLHEWATNEYDDCPIVWIWKNQGTVVEVKPKPDGKMWKGILPGGAQLDLFLTTPQQFGLIYLIRTGSKDFSQAVVTHARNVTGRYVEGGWLHIEGEPVETPAESDVFRWLELQWVEPQNRRDRRDVKAVKK